MICFAGFLVATYGEDTAEYWKHAGDPNASCLLADGMTARTNGLQTAKS